MNENEIEEKITEVRENYQSLTELLNFDYKVEELGELEKTMNQPGFWDNSEAAQEVVKKLKRLKAIVTPFQELEGELEDLEVLYSLAVEEEEEGVLKEVEENLKEAVDKMGQLELQTYFTDENDDRNCYFSIHAGAGGTESCDWAGMLYRMYTRWMERKKYKMEILDHLDGDEAGVKKVTIHVKGDQAFGFLRGEAGVHRLVRISPFDSNNRRHTSFVSVDVTPEFDDIEIEVKEDDLKIDTYRASGAGGQHVNTTDSAVRITHLPSNIVVQCQNERSQHKNKAMAMKMLKAKLYQVEQERQDKERREQYGQKGDIAWGNQIRSYILQPYTLVKDHRMGYDTSNVNAILEGDIDDLIEAYLRWDASLKADQEKQVKNTKV